MAEISGLEGMELSSNFGGWVQCAVSIQQHTKNVNTEQPQLYIDLHFTILDQIARADLAPLIRSVILN